MLIKKCVAVFSVIGSASRDTQAMSMLRLVPREGRGQFCVCGGGGGSLPRPRILSMQPNTMIRKRLVHSFFCVKIMPSYLMNFMCEINTQQLAQGGGRELWH